MPLVGGIGVLKPERPIMPAQNGPRLRAALGVEDAASIDGPSNSDGPAGLGRQWLQGNSFEGTTVTGEQSCRDTGRHHRRDRRGEPVLAKGFEGGLAMSTLDRCILAEKEARALYDEGAQQRNQDEDHEHLDHGEAPGSGTTGGRGLAVVASRSRLPDLLVSWNPYAPGTERPPRVT